jgi:hypothetical protein
MICEVSAARVEKIDGERPRCGTVRLQARQVILGELMRYARQCFSKAEARRELGV